MGQVMRGDSGHDADHGPQDVGDAVSASLARDRRAAVEPARDIVLVRDAVMGVDLLQSLGIRRAGRAPAELRGTRDRDLIDPNDVDARDDLVAGTRPGGAPSRRSSCGSATPTATGTGSSRSRSTDSTIPPSTASSRTHATSRLAKRRRKTFSNGASRTP